jgi:hypothetical protein
MSWRRATPHRSDLRCGRCLLAVRTRLAPLAPGSAILRSTLSGSRATPSRPRHWYRGLAVRGSRAFTVVLLGASSLAAALISGCGGSAPQSASEPKGTSTVQVTQASFPAQQAVSRPERLVLRVRNTGTRTVPNVAVALNSLYYTSNYPNLAARKRPVWVVDQGPGSIPDPPVETVEVDPPGAGTTSNYDVWALGRLAPGATRSFVWHVTPVKAGVHTVSYRVYAGLNGRARAQLAGGGIPGGNFKVAIANRPPPTHVNPETGKVAAGAYSASTP